MQPAELADRRPQPVRHRRACALRGSGGPTGPVSMPEGCGEVVDEGVELGLVLVCAGVVAVRLGLVDLRLEVADALLVVAASRGVVTSPIEDSSTTAPTRSRQWISLPSAWTRRSRSSTPFAERIVTERPAYVSSHTSPRRRIEPPGAVGATSGFRCASTVADSSVRTFHASPIASWRGTGAAVVGGSGRSSKCALASVVWHISARRSAGGSRPSGRGCTQCVRI